MEIADYWDQIFAGLLPHLLKQPGIYFFSHYVILQLGTHSLEKRRLKGDLTALCKPWQESVVRWRPVSFTVSTGTEETASSLDSGNSD